MATYLIHSAKGSTWKKHKYIKIVNGRYIYPKKETETKDRVSTKSKHTEDTLREHNWRDRDGRGAIAVPKEGSKGVYTVKAMYDKGGKLAEENEAKAAAKKQKSKELTEKRNAAKKQAEQRAKTKAILEKTANYMINQKKINKIAPNKVTGTQGSITTVKKVADPVTGISKASTKKPKLNNYKIPTGSSQRGGGTGRNPIGTLSNVSRSKTKKQTTPSGSSLTRKATSSNASRSTTSNAERKKKKKR